MQFSTQLLKTKEDCNAVLADAMETKAALEFRKVSLQRHQVISSGTSMNIDAELQSVLNDISSVETYLATAPEGTQKAKEAIRLLGLQYRKAVLNQRKSSHGSVAILQNEYDMECADQNLASCDSLIAAINARLSEV